MIEDGEPAKTTEYEVGAGINLSSQLVKGGGHAVKLPFIDVSEIGAGGGSIVSVDRGGSLKVGPRSAGAEPGPACYDSAARSRPSPTRWWCSATSIRRQLAGGGVRLNPDAGAARDRGPGRRRRSACRCSTRRWGIYAVAAANMTRAVKAVSTYRGRDPRDFALLAFGGNGPVVAVAIARALDMTRVIVPPAPGVFSAFGLLCSDIEYVVSRTLFRRMARSMAGEIAGGAATRWKREARASLAADGVAPEACDATPRRADLRYAGQALRAGGADRARHAGSRRDDGGLRCGACTHLRPCSPGDPIDLVSLKVLAAIAAGMMRHAVTCWFRASGVRRPARADHAQSAYFGPAAGRLRTPVMSRVGAAPTGRAGAADRRGIRCDDVVPPGLHGARSIGMATSISG